MDNSSSKSNSLNGEEWMDLSKSDYAKVIFSNLYWNSDSGAVGCHFKLTETVNKNPFDYIGLYKVGYENISQCLASKKISELESENDAKLIHCIFKSEELPELNGFYQFLYVTQDQEVSGASMPFAVNNSKNRKSSSDDEVVTEKVEDDFLMVRYGIEQKNDFLEIMVQRLQNEKLALSQELHLLKKEKDEIASEYEATKLQLQTLLSEFGDLKKEKEVLINDLETIKEEKTAVSCEFEVVKEKIISELAIITKSADDLSNELSTVKVERDNLSADLEDCKSDKITMISKLEHLLIELKTVKEEKDKLVSELEACKLSNSKLSTELAISKSNYSRLSSVSENTLKEFAALKKEKRESEELILKRQFNTFECRLKEVEEQKDKALRMKCSAEKREADANAELCDIKIYLKNKDSHRQYALWQEKENALRQIADLETMLRAMEDSKQLVMKEMGEIASKLNKTKEELAKAKCENILLKINVDDLNEENSRGTTRLVKEMEKEVHQTRQQLEFSRNENESLMIQMRFVQKQNLNKENEIMDLNKKLREKEAKVSSVSKEKSELQEEILALQKLFEDKLFVSKDIYLKLKERNPDLEEDRFEAELQDLTDQFGTNFENLHKLEKEILEKDQKLEQLNEEMKQLKENEAAALTEVAEKTARLMEAAELYKELYIGKQKLLKKMNKILHNKSKGSLIKVLEDSSTENSESDFLPLNIKDYKQSSPSNSDSDTGEHFCPEMTPLQVKELNFQTFVPVKDTLTCLGQDSLIQSSGNKTIVDEKSLSICDQENKTEFSDALRTGSLPSDEKMYEIPCSVCEKLFSVSSTSNISLLEHYEKEHKLDMCPVCGQLFEKCVPSKYLNIHINKHFESK